jgi:hypothetical protein
MQKNLKNLKNKKINTNDMKKTVFEDISNYKVKNKRKISTENFTIPTVKEYNNIVFLNYNAKQLKMTCKFYNLKSSGSKTQLKYTLFNYLKYSYFSVKIQSLFRCYLVRHLNYLKGPALKNRICVNETDFLMFEDLNSIDYDHFFSFKDKDKFTYGFNITSLVNLIKEKEKNKKFANPYNRNIIDKKIQDNIYKIIKISKILNRNINLTIENNTNLPFKKQVELKCVDLFSNIDSYGHTTDPMWFYNLQKKGLLKFINELMDIWHYRLNLPQELKFKICPPHGKPFLNLRLNHLFQKNINEIKSGILKAIENIISRGVDNNSKSLGAYYVLGCLTLVSQEAAISLPWLYDTFHY